LFQKLGRRIRAEFLWLDRFLVRWSIRCIHLGMHATVLVGACYFAVYWLSRERIYDRPADVPAREVGVVLGCSKMLGADENPIFNAQIKSASALYTAGRVQYLVVSGDQHEGYNEPGEMKAALMAVGVPGDRIYCDYAGFRILDSVLRAQQVFGLKEFIVISQRFNNSRALYIAKRSNMPEVVALNASNSDAGWMAFTYVREIIARVSTVLDVEMFSTKPKVLGPRIKISSRTPPVDTVPVASAGS